MIRASTLTFKDVTTPGACPGNYSVTRTWTATDDCGNTSTASQTINVQDITAPVIAALPAPTTIDCPATPSFAQAVATDTCDQSVTLTFKDVTTPGSCPGNYSVTRTWTATDDCGNASTASQTITVQDITAPVIAALPEPTTIDCPATPSFAQATATDTCDPSVTLTFKDVTTPAPARQLQRHPHLDRHRRLRQLQHRQPDHHCAGHHRPGHRSAAGSRRPLTARPRPSFAQATATDLCDQSVDPDLQRRDHPRQPARQLQRDPHLDRHRRLRQLQHGQPDHQCAGHHRPGDSALPAPTTIDCPAPRVRQADGHGHLRSERRPSPSTT